MPISASRLQRSTTSWERRTWLSMSRSRLLATTSPLTARFMSVTSSGRSSIKQDDQLDAGVVGGDAEADVLQEDRLAGSRRGDDQRPLAFAQRRQQVHHPGGQRLGPVSSLSQYSGLMGVSSSKVLTFL